MKYLSLFSGIGGFELGIGDKAECIGYSEVDKYAIQIYERHFNHKNYGDITKINEKELPDFDLLCGGFPCQAFSIAGKRRGFADTRGTLFFDIARIVREKQPRLLLLENVKGLLSHEEGRTFTTIISTLDELGYDCQWQVLNSKNFGVPQNRERVFIIGHLRGFGGRKVFPLRQESGHNSEQTEELHEQVSNCLRTNYGNASSNETYVIHKNHGKVEETEDISHNLDSNYWKGLDNHGQRTGILKNSRIRRLTPTECERLQGFPDGWTEGVSDTQRYKCLGNAVTVNVIQAISDLFITD